MVAASLWILTLVFTDYFAGNGISPKQAGSVVFLGAVGAYFGMDGLKRGPYLEVSTPQGVEKFPLQGSLDPIAWSKFRGQAYAQLGYEILDTGANVPRYARR